MKRICIITARSGSKRTPNKNIRDFCGKPMMSYSIKAGIDSGLFDVVMVSTDSELYANIAREYGAEVPFLRSEATSNDFASTSDVIREVITEYEKLGQEFDEICCIYPCAPFVTGEKLKNACKVFEESGADGLTPVCKFSYPPQRAYRIKENNRLIHVMPEFAPMRSQDIEPWYHDCGQFYFWKTDYEMGRRKGNGSIPFIIPEEETQDIDNESDFIIAEMKYKSMNK